MVRVDYEYRWGLVWCCVWGRGGVVGVVLFFGRLVLRVRVGMLWVGLGLWVGVLVGRRG